MPGLGEGWATWSGEDSKIYPHEEFPFYFELPEYYHDKYIGVKLTIQTGWHKIPAFFRMIQIEPGCQ